MIAQLVPWGLTVLTASLQQHAQLATNALPTRTTSSPSRPLKEKSFRATSNLHALAATIARVLPELRPHAPTVSTLISVVQQRPSTSVPSPVNQKTLELATTVVQVALLVNTAQRLLTQALPSSTALQARSQQLMQEIRMTVPTVELVPGAQRDHQLHLSVMLVLTAQIE